MLTAKCQTKCCLYEKTRRYHWNGCSQPEWHRQRGFLPRHSGRHQRREARSSSFDPSDLPVQIAGEVQGFDELAWVDAHERKHVSRVVPLALAASTEALRDAGIETSQLSLDQQREIGVVLGSGGGAQEFSEEQVRLWLTGKVKQVSLFCIPSGTMGTLSSEVSMRFGLRGMSHVITTGCTSSTDAFGYALRQIQFGFLPMMVVGGVDAPIAPGIMKGFTLMKIMTSSWNHAPERASRPFSADRDGFVVAEGAWMFLLEEYEHARARGAQILAEVAGYGSTCEAFHRVRLQECGEEPARAIRWRCRTPASPATTWITSACTAPRRNSTIASRRGR